MFVDEIMNYQPFWGEWVIDCKIGEGSFGSVFRISRQDFTFVNKAAMKVISVPKDQKEYDQILAKTGSVEAAQAYCDGIRERLLNEIKIMNRFKGNSSIVSMEDYKVFGCPEGQFGFTLIIRMELCKTISEHIAGKQDFFANPMELVKLGTSICDALTVLHSNSILHRDIKPGNIFVSQDGNYKLGDFGMAAGRFVGEEDHHIAGTYDYMAPEVFKGVEYDARADIYSLGLTLYYYANGLRGPYLENVFEAPTREDKDVAVSRRMNRERMLPPIFAPQGLSEVILRACAFEPNERYFSADEMKSALVSFGGTIPTPGYTGGYRSGSVSAGQSLALGSVSGSLSYSASAIGKGSVYRNGSVIRPEVEETPQKKRNGLLITLIVTASVLLLGGAAILFFSLDGMELFTSGNDNGIRTENIENEENKENPGPDEASEKRTLKDEDDKYVTEYDSESNENDKEKENIRQEETPLEEHALIDPVLVGEVSVTSINGRVLKGMSVSELILQAEFSDGSEIIDGELTLEGIDLIRTSGDYTWKFRPYRNELYNETEGTVKIMAFEPEMIEGLAQYEKIPNKSEILYLNLEGEGLTDVSFLADAVNIEKLNLDDNDLTDLKGLENCIHLQSLAFNNNENLVDVSALWELKELRKVYMDSTGLSGSDEGRLKEMIRVNAS